MIFTMYVIEHYIIFNNELSCWYIVVYTTRALSEINKINDVMW